MLEREELERREEERLAPYAVKSGGSRGRKHPEPEDPFRSVFQRDRDRVIHSAAFRRLEYKTQVFVNHEGDHYRTRLTHTIEVSQIARSVSRALRLNEDLTEAIVLAHDLGHTPFGHAGERVMDALMEGEGGFEHNLQSLRVVDVLEKRYPHFDGLNLSYEVREGICKHSSEYDHPPAVRGFDEPGFPCLEAQVADISDEIAYCNHDVEDGLRSGMLTPASLESVELWREALLAAYGKYKVIDEDVLYSRTISHMISSLTQNLIRTSHALLGENGIRTPDEGRTCRSRCISFDGAFSAMKDALKAFLLKEMYGNYRVIRMEQKARRIIGDLFHSYCDRPEQLPPHIYSRVKIDGIRRVVCDYIAGMTDRYAMEEYRKLFDPLSKV
ncbi:MAG: deoxyguanosinetriphosphate triphosphohydrolase [Deltaproteobacteria bacterium]|nr:deoxyguanosinetriphosphate triphosphohydrolase [Deltaproteobacteria bacterium]